MYRQCYRNSIYKPSVIYFSFKYTFWESHDCLLLVCELLEMKYDDNKQY